MWEVEISGDRDRHTECWSQGRAKLRAFLRHLARENTQLSPSLTPTLVTPSILALMWSVLPIRIQFCTFCTAYSDPVATQQYRLPPNALINALIPVAGREETTTMNQRLSLKTTRRTRHSSMTTFNLQARAATVYLPSWSLWIWIHTYTESLIKTFPRLREWRALTFRRAAKTHCGWTSQPAILGIWDQLFWGTLY